MALQTDAVRAQPIRLPFYRTILCQGRVPSLLAVLIIVLAGCRTESQSTARRGEFLDATIAPADSRVIAEPVDLHAYFESLGPDAIAWYQHVHTLSDPFLEGRVPGERGGTLAAAYIEHYFRKYGLQPAFAADSISDAASGYRQPFEFTVKTGGHVHSSDRGIHAGDVDQHTMRAANIGAILPGTGRLAHEYLVIGGHYDHVGTGELSGSGRHNGHIHPGADDNASGVAGVLVLAKRLSETYASLPRVLARRSILFVAFDGEEYGLHGSRAFVESDAFEEGDMSLMVNLDMVGRLRDNRLSILGVGTGTELRVSIESVNVETGFNLDLSDVGSGRSDDQNFANAQVPAIHFFTGMTPEYTSPADQAYTMNPAGAVRIIDLIESLVMEFATEAAQVTFRNPGPGKGTDRGYGKIRMGARPGMAGDLKTGVLVDSVAIGTSAHDAGIKAGDIMLRWDDVELVAVRTYADMIKRHKPGDVVNITVLRDGEELVIPVTLKASTAKRK